MHFVGKLDKELYSCIAKVIVAEDVIITDERIAHIKERRGEAFYNNYQRHFKEILTNPDFIFSDGRPNTALVCKSFDDENAFVNLVIRLTAEGDTQGYKNSILTAIRENRRRFAQRLRNNLPLYKKE